MPNGTLSPSESVKLYLITALLSLSLKAAVILVGGGYVAGQRAKQSSIVSALPKNILDMPKESNEPSESAEPESKPSEDVPEPKEDVRIINKSN